jgi:N6-adenosine-specific RNA methylase IME4/predicted DNA-binding protein
MKNEITVQNNNLPTKLEDLSKFVLIGKEKLVSVKAEIRAMKNLKVAEEVYKQKEIEAKELGGALLLAKVRIGEMLKDIPKNIPNPKKKNNEIDNGVKNDTKKEQAEKLGFSQKDTSRFQQLAANKEIVDQVIENSEDIPTQTECLKKIQDKKKAKRNKERQETIKNLKPIEGKYKIIYADPPWSYNDKQDTNKLGGAKKHYNLMNLDDICNMPIKDKTEDNAVLFLWGVVPQLEEALQVIKAWGFKYKTHFVWDKVKHNMGHYSSVRHELLFVATKGSCTPENIKLFDSVQSIEKTNKHSEKPEEFRNIIDTLYPSCNRIEIFSRKKVDNWDVWGNEI